MAGNPTIESFPTRRGVAVIGVLARSPVDLEVPATWPPTFMHKLDAWSPMMKVRRLERDTSLDVTCLLYTSPSPRDS